eukprot:9471281-Pyramimonas_sp.AAC.1
MGAGRPCIMRMCTSGAARATKKTGILLAKWQPPQAAGRAPATADALQDPPVIRFAVAFGSFWRSGPLATLEVEAAAAPLILD